MSKIRCLYLMIFCSLMPVLMTACAEMQQRDSIFGDDDNNGRMQRNTYDISFCGFDSEILDPSLDRRSYYKVYIDKTEAGRTTIGLESQKKFFDAAVSVNRHLISVEKWVLNEKTGSYEKLNKVYQPKPAYCYFESSGAKVAITMEVLSDNRAVFTVAEEKN